MKKFNEEQKKIIREKCFPEGVTEKDIEYGILIAEILELNPILGEISYIMRSFKNNKGRWENRLQPLVGRDGYLTIAHRTGKFDGMDTTVELAMVPVLAEGKWKEEKELIAKCTVYRKDSSHPVTVTVAFGEYAQYTKDGKLTSFWREKPKTMLAKVAESQALRKAFNISGVYSAEELGLEENISEGSGIVSEEDLSLRPSKETKTETTEENENNQPKSLEDIEESLNLMGLKLNGDTVEGKTYGKGSYLKSLGFKWFPDERKWKMAS